MPLLIGLVVAALLLVPVYIVHGFVLHLLWGWFMVPALHVPALGIGYAIGVSLTLNMFISTAPSHADAKARRSHAVVTLARPLLALVIGYILHLILVS